MSRSGLLLAVCTGLVFIGTGIQSNRATRFQADARSLRSAGVSLDRLDAEIAELHAVTSELKGRPADELTLRVALGRVAAEIARVVKLTGAELITLSVEPAGPTLAVSATGDRFAIARLVSRIDSLLDSHAMHADRFSLTGADAGEARVDLSVIPRPRRMGSPSVAPAWPTADVAAVATALASRRTPGTSSNDLEERLLEPATSGGVRWIGTIIADRDERYVLSFDRERVVAVLGAGDRPVLGWSVRSRESDLLHLSKEGMRYEVHR